MSDTSVYRAWIHIERSEPTANDEPVDITEHAAFAIPLTDWHDKDNFLFHMSEILQVAQIAVFDDIASIDEINTCIEAAKAAQEEEEEAA